MNIANKLTVFRIFMIPVFVLLLSVNLAWGSVSILGTEILWQHFIAGLIFAVASFTDYLDGYLARKYNLVTQFGVFADPMADKLLVAAALIMLVELNMIAGWMAIIIIARELLVTGLRVLLARQDGQVLAAALPGKIKTFTQMFSIVFYLWNDIGFKALGIPMADILLIICLIFTLYSGWDYFYQARYIFKDAV